MAYTLVMLKTSCTPWTGRVNKNGYGTIGKDLAHRRVWVESGRELAPDETLDHLCHDPNVCKLGADCPHRRCVNPDHLQSVSALENKRRGGSRCEKITHCPEGHEYTGDNVLVSGGKRYCRTCRRGQLRDRRHAAKVAKCYSEGHAPDFTTSDSGKTYCRICYSAARTSEQRIQAS